jgi:hypothetical protein
LTRTGIKERSSFSRRAVVKNGVRFLLPPASRSRREEAFRDEAGAELDAEGVVAVEDSDGHAADGGPADQERSIPAEMPGPLVAPGIEQRRELAGLRVEAGEVGALVAVVERQDVTIL